MSTVSQRSPMPSGQRWAFISMRSMTPRNPPSAPTGSCSTTGLASRRSAMESTEAKKSAPMRSILLTKQMRGTP